MNRLDEIESLSFTGPNKTNKYSCVSGRLKYNDSKFSIKCRIKGLESLEEENETVEIIEIKTKKVTVVIKNIAEIIFNLNSTSMSVEDQKITSKYLVHGKRNIEEA